jgi:HEAT repeat protein
LASSTLSDPILKLVVWISLALLVVLLLLVFQIVILRINLISRTAREKRFLEIWRPALANCIISGEVILPTLAKADQINFLKLWNHLQESLRGDAKNRLNDLAKKCGILDYSRTLLRKNNLRLQLLAINTLGHLGDRSSWLEILQLARLPDPLISLAAARALFQIDANDALDDVVVELLEREDWPTAQLAILLEELGNERIFEILSNTASSLASSTDPVELEKLKRLLRLLEIAPYQLVILSIRTILSVTTDDEVIAQCLKFLRKPDDLHFVLRYLNHTNWVVRLQAARAFGLIGSREDLPRLSKLLSDPVWWVRYRTAQTILELISEGSAEMSALRAQLTDRYAQDMLDMVIAEKDKR